MSDDKEGVLMWTGSSAVVLLILIILAIWLFQQLAPFLIIGGVVLLIVWLAGVANSDNAKKKKGGQKKAGGKSPLFELPVSADNKQGQNRPGQILLFDDHLEVNGIFSPKRSFKWDELEHIQVAYDVTTKERFNKGNLWILGANLTNQQRFVPYVENYTDAEMFFERIEIKATKTSGKQSLSMKARFDNTDKYARKSGNRYVSNRIKALGDFKKYAAHYTTCY